MAFHAAVAAASNDRPAHPPPTAISRQQKRLGQHVPLSASQELHDPLHCHCHMMMCWAFSGLSLMLFAPSLLDKEASNA